MIFLHASKSYPEGRSAIRVISERGWPWLSSDLKKRLRFDPESRRFFFPYAGFTQIKL